MKLKVAITGQTNGNVVTRTVFIDALHMNGRLLLEPANRPSTVHRSHPQTPIQ